MSRSQNALFGALGLLVASATVGAASQEPLPDPPGEAAPLGRLEWRTLAHAELGTLEYAVLLPPDFEPEATVPVVLALPPGGQDRELVLKGLELYFEVEAPKRGYVVVSPAAPAGRSFHAEGEPWLALLLDRIEADFHVEGGRVHAAGVSNGGRSAFRLATRMPARLASLTGLPGAASDEDLPRLRDLAGLPIRFYVGAEDAGWLQAARTQVELLHELGAEDVDLFERAGEEHVLAPSLAPVLFDHLDTVRAQDRARARERDAIGAVLDELHAAAAEADEARYFGCFAPGAVFIGTDASERWSLAEFRAYAHEPFAAGRGWTYELRERHVTLAFAAGTSDLAWFDERLHNSSYGETRGSGVLKRTPEGWRIAQYVLSFAVPNDAAKDVVERIRREAEGR